MKRTAGPAAAMLVLSVAAGCHTPPAEMRHREAADWERRAAAAVRTALERTGGRRWTLRDCRAIAREQSLELTRARLVEQAARARAWASFSAFLPQVELQLQTVSMDEPPLRRLGEMTVAFQDQSVRQTTLRIVQPLFAPEAWLLHAVARRGANAQRLARERAGEWLDLAVADRFAHCAIAEVRLHAARRALASATTAAREAAARGRNGLATAAEVAAADAAEAARRFEVAALERNRRAALARLLETMGLPPTIEPELDVASLTGGPPTPAETAAQTLERPVEEWLYDALRHRRDLQIADENVEARRTEILRAIALFLPRLYGFADHYTTSDSFVVHDEYWASGLQATLSLFSGFRNVQAVRIARAEWREARTMRDLTALAAMVQVIEARRALADALDQWRLTTRVAEAARLAAAEAESAYANGRAALSVRDRARAALVDAEAAVEVAETALALAVEVFRDVVGARAEDRQ
ncbi:MAG: TolC family protein [Kiritimatiellae bacterium]|nr:TolC family protein [Kiritimatiellia bacterium]